MIRLRHKPTHRTSESSPKATHKIVGGLKQTWASGLVQLPEFAHAGEAGINSGNATALQRIPHPPRQVIAAITPSVKADRNRSPGVGIPTKP